MAPKPRRNFLSRALGRPPRTVRTLASSESGQALIFGALTLMMLAAFVIFVADTGLVTSSRVQVQNAADECAYAGALYEANVVSAVAYLNEAMAYLYFDALRYATDSTMLGVLATLKRYDERYDGPPPPDLLVYTDEDKSADPPLYSGNVIPHYDLVYAKAREAIPAIEGTLNMFARWEWGMALACAELVEMEINRVALKHGVEAIAMYPEITFFPGSGVQFDLHILKLMEDLEHVGWRVWTDDPPFYVEARKLGPFHWLITNTDRTTYEIERLDDITYRIQTPTQDITVKRYSDDHVALKIISEEDDETKTIHVDAVNLPNLGWAVSMSDGEFSVSYRPFEQGGYFVEVVNHVTNERGSAGIRRGANGHMEQWTGTEWQEVPNQRDTVTVDNAEVPVSISHNIQLGPDLNFTMPNRLDLGSVTYLIPDQFLMPNIWVTMLEDSVRIDAFINIQTAAGGRQLRFTIEEHTREMTIYGLLGINYRVPDSATCEWHSNREGSERDRLCRDCQLLDGDCTTPADDETEWTYQYRRGNPYLVREDLRRFAHHAIADAVLAGRDVYPPNYHPAEPFEHPQWAEWYDIAAGAPRTHDYFQTRPTWGAEPNYDSNDDSIPDCVRIYATHTWGLREEDDPDRERDFDPHYRMVKPWDYRNLAAAASRFVPPLRLSEDFFFHGLSVGCWRSRRGGKQSLFRLFREPEWGIVAFASARCGFLETISNDPLDNVPHYRFTWPTLEEVEEFANAGYENLYEPVWTAHLWPMTDAVRSEHLKAYVPNQTGLSYLFHGLFHARWYKPRPPEEIGEEPEEVSVPLGAMGLDTGDPEMDNVVQH